jgi:DUF971 family protein
MTAAGARAPHPVEVERKADQRTVRIQWSDGHVGEYPFAYLRGWCPCAACQGHGGERHYVHAADTELKSISVVGNYALNLHWGDGHESGIYSYRYLRDLCPCEECGGGIPAQ